MPSHSSSEIQAKAAEIVARDDYRLEAVKNDSGWLLDIMSEALELILVPFRWLFHLTEGLPEALRWIIVVGLIVLLVLLVAHIIYSFYQSFGHRLGKSTAPADEAHRRLDPRRLESLADEAAAKHDFITAVRLLFRAGVLRIEEREAKTHRPGATNRELLRRYQKQPSLAAALRLFVDVIDRKWYGDELCTDSDYAACRGAHDDLCRLTQGKLDAHRA